MPGNLMYYSDMENVVLILLSLINEPWSLALEVDTEEKIYFIHFFNNLGPLFLFTDIKENVAAALNLHAQAELAASK